MASLYGNNELAGSKRTASELDSDTQSQNKRRKFEGCSSIRNYVLMSKLGEGTFGEVYKAESRVSGQIVALKKILMHQEKDGFPVTALREIKLLKMLCHPNILKLEEMAIERAKGEGRRKATIYMVTPYMDHDLSGLLENPSVDFTEGQIKCYMMQILDGIVYLHKSKILHRDMKAANLLINNEGVLQIADFGLARPYDDPAPQRGKGNGEATRAYTTVVVTRWYRPPELLLQLRNYTPAIDMWGVGCIFGEMFKKRPILPGNSDLNQLQLVFDLVGSPNEQNMPGWHTLPGCEGVKTFPERTETISQVFADQGLPFTSLLKDLLRLDWRKRINAMDALEHPYFKTHPYPLKPSDLPSFPESHELDRRKFREQKANPPPAPAGGTVGMNPDTAFANENMPSTQKYSALMGRGMPDSRRDQPRPYETSRGQRIPHSSENHQMRHARKHAWERPAANGLPPRPPVEVPAAHKSINNARISDGIVDSASGSRRNRDFQDSGRGRSYGPYVDTYIPSYSSREDRKRHMGDESYCEDRGKRRHVETRDHDSRDNFRRPGISEETAHEWNKGRQRDSFPR